MPHKTIRISIALGLIVGLIGCGNTSSLRTDAAMDLAMRQQEARTFERLSHSNSDDIAVAARTLARGRQ
jgi:hypothetical protein